MGAGGLLRVRKECRSLTSLRGTFARVDVFVGIFLTLK